MFRDVNLFSGVFEMTEKFQIHVLIEYFLLSGISSVQSSHWVCSQTEFHYHFQ